MKDTAWTFICGTRLEIKIIVEFLTSIQVSFQHSQLGKFNVQTAQSADGTP